MMKNALIASVALAALVAMTGCSSDSGGGGGTSALATGGFLKSVNDGATSSNAFPFTADFAYQKAQHLYIASDIQGSGDINKITFAYATNEVATQCPEMTIRMGHTSLVALTSTFADNVEEGKGSLQVVEDNTTINIPAGNAGETFDIELSTPFAYNGVDNLVVEFEHSAACTNSVGIVVTSSGYVSRVFTNVVADTGSPSDVSPYTVFTFAGGVNMQDYGAGNNHSLPFGGAPVHLQHLYTAADINGSGPITGYALQMNSVSSEGNYTMTVKMGHTSSDALVATYADNSSDFKVVATDVAVNIPAGIAAGDWVWVPLNGSFNYNGTDNFVVDIEQSASSGVTNVVNAVNIGGSVRVYAAAGTATGNVDGYINNAKFRFNGVPMSVIDSNVVAYGTPLNVTTNGMQAIYGAYTLGTGAAINSIGLRVAGDVASDVTYTGANITMGHTTLSDLSSTLADNMDDAKVVFTGNITVPAGTKAGDWITLPVSGFTYDPTKNLTVQILPGTSDATTPLFYSGNGIVSNSGTFAVGDTTISGFEGSLHPQLQLGLSK